MIRTLVLSAALAAGVAQAADMKTVVTKLRAEPMSMFDWGLFLVEEELQSVRRKQSDYLRVSYDPASEKILVDAVFLIDRDEADAIGGERACYTRHHAIKLTFGIIDTDRIHIAPAADFRLGMKFSHHNSDAYPELPDAARIGADLMKSIHIKVGVATNPDEFPFDLIARCAGMALSQDVEYNNIPPRSADPLTE